MQVYLHSLFVDLVIVYLRWSLSPVNEVLVTLSDGYNCDIRNWVVVHSRIVIIDVINQTSNLAISDYHLQSNALLFSAGPAELEVASFEAAVKHLNS